MELEASGMIGDLTCWTVNGSKLQDGIDIYGYCARCQHFSLTRPGNSSNRNASCRLGHSEVEIQLGRGRGREHGTTRQWSVPANAGSATDALSITGFPELFRPLMEGRLIFEDTHTLFWHSFEGRISSQQTGQSGCIKP